MKIYRAGRSAPYGLYVSAKPLDLHFVSADGETLQGREEARYRKLPNALVVAAGPVIGGVFVMAFPVIVLAAVAWAMVKLAARAGRRIAERHGHLARLDWEPSAAYLQGSSKANGTESSEKPEPGDAQEDGELVELEQEVAERLAKERSRS